MTTRPPVAFVGWTPGAERAREIAAALGGEARTFYSMRVVRRGAVPLRYAVDAVRTAAYLGVTRPRALIVTNPPIFPALIGLAYCRLARAPLALDSHPSAFGLAGDTLSRRLLRLHAWVARRAASTLVSAPALAAQVRSWGGQADILHEAPPDWSVAPATTPAGRPNVLFPGVFSNDEPVAEVVRAAQATPELDVVVTGDLRRCPPALRRTAPPNVRFVDFLMGDDYIGALSAADAIVSLSTEPTSVMRTAHEAVWAGRPLVMTDRPDLRELFPGAVHVSNDARGIATGIRVAMRRHAELVAGMPAQRAAQEARWRAQLDVLRCRLGIAAGPRHAA